MLENHFKTLPLEILLKLCGYLENQHVLALREADVSFATMGRSDEIWEAKFEIHFPHCYDKLKHRNPAVAKGGWYEEFVRTYDAQYASIKDSRVRNLFSRVKEEKNQDFTDVLYDDFNYVDKNGFDLVNWARAKSNQSALNHFYWVLEDRAVQDRSSSIVGKAILCRQPNEKIKELFQEFPSYMGDHIRVLAFDGNLTLFEFVFDHIFRQTGQSIITHNRYARFKLLARAAMEGHTDFVSYLLEKGSDPTQKLANGDTPLHLATQNGHLEVVKALIQKDKALLYIKNVKGLTPLLMAIILGHLDLVKVLIEHDKKFLEQKDKAGKDPLLLAAYYGHLEMVSYLLEQGAQVQVTTNNGEPPLCLAAERGHTEVVRCLLKANANPFAVTKNTNFQAIHLAAENGHLDVLKVLLEHDRSLLDEKDAYEQTPLLWAAAKGHVELVRYLLDAGANPKVHTVVPHKPEQTGRTSLFWAAANGHLEVVRVLIEWDLTLANVVNGKGGTPLTEADANGYPEIVVLLRQSLPPAPANCSDLIAALLKLDTIERYEKTLKHFQIRSDDRLSWVKEILSWFYFLKGLPESNFKAFFKSVVQAGISSMDEVLMAVDAMVPETEGRFKANQDFINKTVAAFTPYRKELEALISELKTKSEMLKETPIRFEAVNRLVVELQKEMTAFFTNPTSAAAQAMFERCEMLVKDKEPYINLHQTNEIWRGFYKFLLAVAHVFLITIPFIWLHPDSRNLLLDKTDTQAKAEAVVDRICQLNQLVVRGKFSRVFSAVPPVVLEEGESLGTNVIVGAVGLVV